MLGEPAEWVGAMIGVVEALMCASDRESGGLYGVFCGYDHGPTRRKYHRAAVTAREVAELTEGFYEASCAEAAYRIIERCPKLRKEWFGR